MNVSGILVVVSVANVPSSVEKLAALPGVDVHHIDEITGRSSKMGQKRRDFLKASVAASAAVAIGLPMTSEALAMAGTAEVGWKWDKGEFTAVSWERAYDAIGDEVAPEDPTSMPISHVPQTDAVPWVTNTYQQ